MKKFNVADLETEFINRLFDKKCLIGVYMCINTQLHKHIYVLYLHLQMYWLVQSVEFDYYMLEVRCIVSIYRKNPLVHLLEQNNFFLKLIVEKKFLVSSLIRVGEETSSHASPNVLWNFISYHVLNNRNPLLKVCKFYSSDYE